MNNAFLEMESLPEVVHDTKPELRTREGELVKIIEALRKIEQSEEWSTLKEYVFDGVLESLEGRLMSEAGKSEISAPAIYRLQGQILWAKKYSNLESLAHLHRAELTGIKNKLNA